MKKLLRILAVCLLIAMAAGLVKIMMGQYQKDAERQALFDQLHEEARPYEREIAEIRKELERKKRQISPKQNCGGVVMTFQPESTDDLDIIAGLAAKYKFTPSLLLNVNVKAELLEAAQETGYELILSASPLNWQQISRFRQANSFSTFLLRNTDEAADSLTQLAQAGFTGMVRYTTRCANGVMENKLPCINYIFVRSNTQSILTYLDSYAADRETLMLVFEMSALRSEKMTVDGMEFFIAQIQEYIEMESLEYQSAEPMLETVRILAATSAARREQYDIDEAEAQKRIEALQNSIHEIYKKLNSEE